MGRTSKFSFPLPGLKLYSEKGVEVGTPLHDWETSRDDFATTKAEQWFGSGGLQAHHPFRKPPTIGPILRTQPSHLTVTVSEASYGEATAYEDMTSATAVEDLIVPPRWATLHPKASSNILGAEGSQVSGRPSSINSDESRRIRHQVSSSTMRSHYDSKKSPLAISQQTSASAVRDMALRKGHRPISEALNEEGLHVGLEADKAIPDGLDMPEKSSRRKRPSRLDLSKLFPKPQQQGGNLLSPNKLMNSPTPMSSISEYFPRHSTGTQKEAKTSKEGVKPTRKLTKAKRPPKPNNKPQDILQRNFQRDIFDNAKVNIRRPPRGIQNWFDGLGESTDEDTEGSDTPVEPTLSAHDLGLATSRGTLASDDVGRGEGICSPIAPDRPLRLSPAMVPERRSLRREVTVDHQPKPSDVASVASQRTAGSSKKRRSVFLESNLQENSVLSVSSSDEEPEPNLDLPAVRDSIVVSDLEDNVLICRAKACDVRPRSSGRATAHQDHQHRPSELSNIPSTTTIPNPDIAKYLSVPCRTRSRRSGHTRQPAAIAEQDLRPLTSGNGMLSASTAAAPQPSRGIRGSSSETHLYTSHHKLMAVTEEEEALLEMMRQKRAAMAKHSFTEGYKTAIEQGQGVSHEHEYEREGQHDESPVPIQNITKALPRTSGFSSTFSPTENDFSQSVLGPVPASALARQPSTGSSPTYQSHMDPAPPSSPPNNARSYDDPSKRPHLRSARSTPSPPLYYLPTPRTCSPLNMFPPASTPSDLLPPATPTTPSATQTSPLPSPLTPSRRGSHDVAVKVAGSEASSNGDADTGLAFQLDAYGMLGTGRVPAATKSSEDVPATAKKRGDVAAAERRTEQEDRRRWNIAAASRASTTRATTNPSPTSTSTPTHPASVTAPGMEQHDFPLPPAIPPRSTNRPDSHASSKRTSKLSSNSSVRTVVRDSLGGAGAGAASGRRSVSEDVLAAWGSLGGWRDLERVRVWGL